MMMRLFTVFLFAALVLSAQTPAVLSQSQGEYQIHSDPHRDPWQQPDQVISALKLSTSETVAVIENGFPYFPQRIAPLVKKVYAVNSDARAFQGRGTLPPSIPTIVSTNEDPNIKGLGFDTVIMVDVLSLLPQRLPYYLGIASGLKPGGRLVIIDRNLPATRPSALNDQLVESELPAAGFRIGQKLTISPYQYFLVFQF
jgi:hypothetical protein